MGQARPFHLNIIGMLKMYCENVNGYVVTGITVTQMEFANF